MVKHEIAGLVRAAVAAAQASGELPAFDLPAVTVGRPKEETHGDYDCPLALKLARVAGMPPLGIAKTIARHLPPTEFVAAVEVAAPGFLNFSLSDSWLAQQVNAVLSAGDAFGNVDLGAGKRVQVEFVSANPTGPLHIGSARNAAIGDTLANLLAAAGYSVQREYYVNDTGNQIRHFAATLYARYAQALGREEPMPTDGYAGAYMRTIADEIVREEGSRFLDLPREEATAALGDLGLRSVVAGLDADCRAVGICFDNWFSERSLYSSGLFDRVLAMLKERGLVTEYDGAVWFASKELGQDKDNVIVRSTGDGPTYFASDIAYMWDKLVDRGFDRAIYVWGADHQGDVPRLKVVAQVLGLDPERVTFLLYQMVTLKRGGEIVRLSKRTGDIVTLREVVEDVGADAVRYFLLARAATAQMDFDLKLAKEHSDENPVYYVQYGHARIASILRHAEESGLSGADGDVSLLTHPAELALIRRMLQLPELVEVAVEELTPHVLPHYALELATLFHSFYKQCRVVSSLPEDRELSMARLRLARAAQIVLARSLRLMGLSAPESM
jgi:arginyl-tRNA synthetase